MANEPNEPNERRSAATQRPPIPGLDSPRQRGQVDNFLAAIRVGSRIKHACLYARLNYDTYSSWIKLYPEFAEAVTEEMGRNVVGSLAQMEKAATEGDWRAAWEKLKMLYPEEYGRQVRDVNVAVVPFTAKQLSDMSDEDFASTYASLTGSGTSASD